MNKVEKVSIGKCAFSLEEKAYAAIKEYLDSLESYYSVRADGKEILEGIEERMAELLMEKTENGSGVVTEAIATEVIAILGKPETIEEDSGSDSGPRYEFTGKKRLYRDPTNKVFGGVCSGLAAYLDMDAALMRVLFVAATIVFPAVGWGHGGSIAPLVYLIAWIAMPKADTLRKQCELRGQSLNIADIENQYRDGAASVPESTSRFWKVFGRICTICVGALLVFMGVSGLIAGGLAAFSTTAVFHVDSQLLTLGLEELFEEFGASYSSFAAGISKVMRILLIVFGSLSYFLPCIGMIYGGIHIIFNLSSPSWKPGLVVFILWLLSVVTFFVLLIVAASSFAAWNSGITAFIPYAI